MTTAFSIVVVFVLSGAASVCPIRRGVPQQRERRAPHGIHSRHRPGPSESLAANDQGNVFGGFIEMQALKKLRQPPILASAHYASFHANHRRWNGFPTRRWFHPTNAPL
jgi:hypothetical protein